MPDKLFGINIKQGSTATFANQWVMIGSCFDQAKNFEEIREELNDLRGIMKCFNSSAATAMRSEKAKNEAIREETRKQVNNWMADILEDINTGERARNLRVEEALHKLSGPQDDGTTSLAKSNRPQDEEVEEKKKADQEEQGATDRKRSLACTVDKFTIPKKAQKMERPQPAKQNEDQNSMIMVYKQALETAKFIKATKDRKKVRAFKKKKTIIIQCAS
uniref:Uncharacterized protein n=1 Tax=Caenorhabditis japonica TaxID=281687 RepID=A0A8R1J178_CAEJA